MKLLKIKMLICLAITAIFALSTVSSAFGMKLDYDQFRHNDSRYGDIYVRWESKLGIYGNPSSKTMVALGESFSWYKPWWDRNNPHGWRYYPIYYIYAWTKLTSPSGRYSNSYSWGRYNTYYTVSKPTLPYVESGWWRAVSVHRYRSGSKYTYRVLRENHPF